MHGTAYHVIGGAAEDLTTFLNDEYEAKLPLGETMPLGRRALQRGSDGAPLVEPENLEICVLERSRQGRKFRRLPADMIKKELGV